MPPMPLGDPWSDIRILLQAESDIRLNGQCDADTLAKLDPYWADFARLLQVYRARNGDPDAIRSARGKMSSGVYLSFIDKVLNRLS